MPLASDLNREHPEYSLRHGLWDRLNLLFKGGDDLRRAAGTFLVPRPKEPGDIYAARLKRFTYQRIMGSVLGWYTSALWKKNIATDRTPVLALVNPKGDFYSQFLDNCDRNETKFTDFWQNRIERALLYKRSFILLDLPNVDKPAVNRKAQLEGGELDPYMVPYEPQDVINWSLDRFGNLEWAVIRTIEQRQEFMQTPSEVTRWWYFDRQEYRIYESKKRVDDGPRLIVGWDEDDSATLVGGGRHAMADQNAVPLFCLELPDALWIGNNLYLQALDHLNQDNSYLWALFMANMPLPTFYTDKDVSGTSFSEASAVVLGTADKFEWAEPSGVSFEHSGARVAEIREEMYRTAYLQAQGRSSAATPAMQSGYSKELDMMPSRDILNAIGTRLRASMRSVLQAVANIRGDKVDFTIRGFDFEEKDAASELGLTEQLAMVDFPSDTARKYQMKRACRALMSDASEDERDKAIKEIESSPTIDEQKQMEAEAQQLRIDQSLSKASAGFVAAAA